MSDNVVKLRGMPSIRSAEIIDVTTFGSTNQVFVQGRSGSVSGELETQEDIETAIDHLNRFEPLSIIYRAPAGELFAIRGHVVSVNVMQSVRGLASAECTLRLLSQPERISTEFEEEDEDDE